VTFVETSQSAYEGKLMHAMTYEAPSIRICGRAVTEELPPIIVLFAGTIALASIAMITVLGSICLLRGGNLEWGYNYFFFVPVNIWFRCIQR
jgi:hypothetical protein